MGREPRSAAEKAVEREYLSKLGRSLTRLREEQNLTPQDLADKLGVTRQYIYMIEKGKAKPSDERLKHLAEALGDLADEFLSTAAEQVERDFETKLREAGLSAEEIAEAATRVSKRAKRGVVAGSEPLRVARGRPSTDDVFGAMEGGEEVVAMESVSEDASAFDYAKSVKEEFAGKRAPTAGAAGSASRPQAPGFPIEAGPDATIVVNRPLSKEEEKSLRDMGKVIAHLLKK